MKFMVNERQILFRKCFFRNMQCVSTEDLKKYQQKKCDNCIKYTDSNSFIPKSQNDHFSCFIHVYQLTFPNMPLFIKTTGKNLIHLMQKSPAPLFVQCLANVTNLLGCFSDFCACKIMQYQKDSFSVDDAII